MHSVKEVTESALSENLNQRLKTLFCAHLFEIYLFQTYLLKLSSKAMERIFVPQRIETFKISNK